MSLNFSIKGWYLIIFLFLGCCSDILYIDELETVLDESMLESFSAEIEDGSIEEVGFNLSCIITSLVCAISWFVKIVLLDLLMSLRKFINVSMHVKRQRQHKETADSLRFLMFANCLIW